MSKIKKYMFDLATTMVITFVVAAGVTYLYSLIVHREGVVNWETAFYLAFIFGIVLPLVNGDGNKKPFPKQNSADSKGRLA